jgi:hypothetical protein
MEHVMSITAYPDSGGLTIKLEEKIMANFRGNRRHLAFVTSLVVIMVLAVTLSSVQAQQVVGYRAGTAPFTAGNAGIVVTFSVPMPTANYSVVVQPTNTAGYSTISQCTYFNVLKKTTTNFQVQHKRCDDGAPVNLDVNVSLDWIAWSHN